MRARVQASRAQGNKMVFLNLRQQTDSVQALLIVTPEKVSKQMVKWAAGLALEAIVRVEAVVKKSPEIIQSASVGDVELHVNKVSIELIVYPNNSLTNVTDLPCFWSRHPTPIHRRRREPSRDGNPIRRGRPVQACAPRHAFE